MCFNFLLTIQLENSKMEDSNMKILVDGFGPAQWLHFPNYFKEVSLLWKKIGFLSIPVGASNFGMCGGMAATVLDIFHSKRQPPSRTTPPSSRDDKALFSWLKKRQAESISFRDFWKYLTFLFTGKKRDRSEVAQAWV